MLKSVLIIDTPDNCTKCNYGGCPVWDDTQEARPKDCPARPLPPFEKQNPYGFIGYDNGFAAGFNFFRERITGESYVKIHPDAGKDS